MRKITPAIWGGSALLCICLVCATGGWAEGPGSASRPATQPAADAGELETSARWRLERAAETLRLVHRVRDLERTVAELARQLGGPTRNLTRRPDTDLASQFDRIDGDIRRLAERDSRLQRDLEALERRVGRLESRRQ